MTASLIGQGVKRIGVPLLRAARGGKRVIRLDVPPPGLASSRVRRQTALTARRRSRVPLTERQLLLGDEQVGTSFGLTGGGASLTETAAGAARPGAGNIGFAAADGTNIVERSNPLVRSTIRGFRRQQEFAAKHPIANLSGELITAGFVGPPAVEFGADLFSDKGIREEGQRITQAHSLSFAQRMQQERLQKTAASNLAMLAALRPEIYNQVATGRILPKGAIVIGGQPDVEGLGAVGSAMAAGAFQRPPTAEEAFLQTLR